MERPKHNMKQRRKMILSKKTIQSFKRNRDYFKKAKKWNMNDDWTKSEIVYSLNLFFFKNLLPYLFSGRHRVPRDWDKILPWPKMEEMVSVPWERMGKKTRAVFKNAKHKTRKWWNLIFFGQTHFSAREQTCHSSMHLYTIALNPNCYLVFFFIFVFSKWNFQGKHNRSKFRAWV